MSRSREADQRAVNDVLDFLESYYADEIGALAQAFPQDRQSLYLECEDIVIGAGVGIPDAYLDDPDRSHEMFEEALRQYELPVDVNLGEANIRVTGLYEEHILEVRDVRAENVETYVGIQGYIEQATETKPKLDHGAFDCQRCGTSTYVPQAGESIQFPHECSGCERQGPFELDPGKSEFVDHAKLKLK